MAEPAPEAVLSEPFGQQSAVVMVLPLLSSVSLIVLAACAIMWYRSHVLVDTFNRSEGKTEWIVQSANGRFLVGRVDHAASIDEVSRNWTYQSRPLRRAAYDPWQPSLWKGIGIEYRNAPVAVLGAVSGWWLRVRWSTLVALGAVLPAWRLLRSWRRGESKGGEAGDAETVA